MSDIEGKTTQATDASVRASAARVIYVGRRWSGQKLAYGWLPAETPDAPDEEMMVYSKLRGTVVGGIYTVMMQPGTTTVYANTLRYAQERVQDDTLVALWQATDASVRASAARQAAERKHAKSGPLEEAIQPVLELAAACRTRHEMSALANHVSEQIRETYWKNHG